MKTDRYTPSIYRLLYKEPDYEPTEFLNPNKCHTFIDLNSNPNQFKLKSSPNIIYMYETNCQFDSMYDIDAVYHIIRKIRVDIKINDNKLYGFTPTENWASSKIMNKMVYNHTYNCIIHFYVVSDDNQNLTIRFLTIGIDRLRNELLNINTVYQLRDELLHDTNTKIIVSDTSDDNDYIVVCNNWE
jgi:hypothetical protein